MRLWDLPGARRFVESACAALRDGCSVVAQFPGEVPAGFEGALTASLGNILAIGRLNGSETPFKDLCNQYASGNNSHIRTIQDLCEDGGFQGRLIWLERLDNGSWPAWRDFLGKYAQTSRSMPVFGRTLFFASLEGTPPGASPSEDIALVTCRWDGVPDELDLVLLANECLRQKPISTVQRNLLSTTVARVAAWDFDSALRLLDENERSILAPTKMLRSVASEKGWTDATPVAWELGTASQSGIVHPARAALEDPPREIERRVWSAQASVLLPWIEARRHEIVARNLFEVRRQMRRSGMKEVDPFDLEIGELATIFTLKGADRNVRKRVHKLRMARNSLAHLQPLPTDMALRLIESNAL